MVERVQNVMPKSKKKVGSAFVIQIAERIEERIKKMKWKTIFEVAKIHLDDGDSDTSRMHSCI